MIIEIGWNGCVFCYNNYSFDDGINLEVLFLVEELNGVCGSEDIEVEVYIGEGIVIVIDDVFFWFWMVNLFEEG